MMVLSNEEIEWSCEYCEASTNRGKRCKKVIKDIEIIKFGVRRKRNRDEDFCQNDKNTVLGGRAENATSTTTLLSSDSQDWRKKGLKKNSGVKVIRKQGKEKGRYVDNDNEHATMVESEPLFKIDGNKVSCNKKLEIAGKEASVGEAFCEEIQGDNVETDRVVEIDRHAPKEKLYIPSCYPKRECMGNGRNFSEIQAGRPQQNVSLVTAELAAGDARVGGMNQRTSQTFFQPTPSGTVKKLVLIPWNAWTLSGPTIIKASCCAQSEPMHREQETHDPRSRKIHNGPLQEAVERVHRPRDDATAGDARVGGMNQRISVAQPTPSTTVKSLHRSCNAQTFSDPRIIKASCSARSEPMLTARRFTGKENHDPGSRKIDNGPLSDAVDRVHRPRNDATAGDGRVGGMNQRSYLAQPTPSTIIKSVHRPGNARTSSDPRIIKDSCSAQSEPMHREQETHDLRSRKIVWDGFFKIDKTLWVPLVCHTSSMSLVKDKDVSKSLPKYISLEKISCPNRFDTRDLTGRDVDVFFIPPDSRTEEENPKKRTEEKVFGILLDMINGNHVLKFKTGDTELHIFSSLIFPESSQKFQGKYYFWGMFSPTL